MISWRALGVSAGYVADMEQNHRRPSLALLNRIVEVLELPGEQALGLAYPKPANLEVPPRKPTVISMAQIYWREGYLGPL